MYVDSFVLTVAAPQIDGGTIVLGEISDGVFTAAEFPALIEFGILLEIALEEDDPPGSREVEVVLEYSRLDGEPQAPVGQSFTIPALEPDEDWWGPRLTPQPLFVRLRLWDELEGYLVVKVDGEEIAEKALRVIHYAVPDAPAGPAGA